MLHIKFYMHARTETSSEIIACRGDPINGFLPGQPLASAGPGLAIAGP